jgi:hypothetical protein
LYSAATPYVLGANNFYPFTYYRYWITFIFFQ